MASSETNETSAEEYSPCPSEDFVELSSPLQIKKREREVAPSGSITRAYLDFAIRIPRDHPLPRLTPSSIDLQGERESNASENNSLEASPTFTQRFSAASPGNEDSPTDRGIDGLKLEARLQRTAFHALPPEVRILIFKEVLRVKEVDQPIPAVEIPTFERVYPTFVNLSQKRCKDKKDSVLNLLEVCRAFYHEALPIFYEVNLLRVSSPTMLYGFLKDLPRFRRQHIRRLRIGGIGFHYSSWQLASKAFSMLNLCDNLEHLEIELAWDLARYPQSYITGFALTMWRAALEETRQPPSDRYEDHENHRAAAINGIQSSTRCLQALRGLKMIRFEMVGLENPLIRVKEEGHASWEALVSLKRTASQWAIKIKKTVT